MSLPKKVYIEVTTRCNLRCTKCIKQVAGNDIQEGDIPFSIFQAILPELAGVQELVLNGIGEPLLHPDLEQMIAAAAAIMPPESSIGFQSNGLLMHPERAHSLVQAGLNTVCFSLDSLEEEQAHSEGISPALHPLNHADRPSQRAVQKAIAHLHQAAQGAKRAVRLGLEIVLSKHTIEDLPNMIHWAGKQGIDYILVSHLFAYDQEMEDESTFSLHSRPALDLYAKYRKKAQRLGINLQEGQQAYASYGKTPEARTAMSLLEDMGKEAANQGLHLRLEQIVSHDEQLDRYYRMLFRQAEAAAETHGMRLSLPPLHAQTQRSCRFIEEEAVFITTQGNIAPCHFLWHSYPFLCGNEIIRVEEKSFANVQDQSLATVWQSPEYRAFRREAAQDNYAPCWTCTQGPCEDLLGQNLLDAADCYASRVPCGHCRWSLGGLRCL